MNKKGDVFFMSEVTRPYGLTIKCSFCETLIPAERHEYYDYHHNEDRSYTQPYPELRNITWDTICHRYACKSCVDRKAEIILNDLLKKYNERLKIIPRLKERYKREYEQNIEKCNKEEQELLLIINELNNHPQINYYISKEVQDLIGVKDYFGNPWRNELKQLLKEYNWFHNDA